MPTTAKKGITGNSNAIVESTTKSKTSETAKNSEKTTTTTKKSNSTQAPTPPQTPPQQPVTPPQPQNPYGYVNAWGTLAQMENDCKAYAQSIGLIYKDDFNMGNGHWITPNSSYGASSPNDFKVKIFDGIEFNKSINTTTIRVLFVTLDNYKDGRCGEHLDVAEMYLRDDTDKISVYLITD